MTIKNYKNVRDLTGQRFGKLVARSIVGQDKHKNVIWLCECDCGRTHEVVSRALVGGSVRSCGCMGHGEFRNKRVEKHGCSKERLYRVWGCMLNRCYDPNRNEYPSYGGRGIEVCDEWRNSYMEFRSWAYSNGYDPTLPGSECTLDRIDVDGNYEPSNCRWIPMSKQCLNKQDTVWITYRGKRITIPEAEKINGIAQSTIRSRLGRNWSVEDAVEKPVRVFKCGNVSNTSRYMSA